MAELAKLIDIFREEKTYKDLALRFRSDYAKSGLETFYSILKLGVEDIGNGKLRFESWNPSEIQAILTVSKLIVSTCHCTSDELEEPLLVAILDESVEFSICYLKKSMELAWEQQLGNNSMELLEVALGDILDKEFDGSRSCSYSTDVSLEPLSSLPMKLGGLELDKNVRNNLQSRMMRFTSQSIHALPFGEGSSCSSEMNSVEGDPVTLAPVFRPPDLDIRLSPEFLYPPNTTQMIYSFRYSSVLYNRTLPHLIKLSSELGQHLNSSKPIEDSVFCFEISLSLRIWKMLGSILKNIPLVVHQFELLPEIACFADVIPKLFGFPFEFKYDVSTMENKCEALLLSLLEEFFHFIKVAFNDGYIFQNIVSCVVASIFDVLDAKIWRYDRSSVNLRVPLVYSPRIIVYLLKVVKDLKCGISQSLSWQDKFGYDCCTRISPSCLVRSEKVSLVEKCTSEKLLKLIFPPTRQWMDNLMNLVMFLHSEGIKLMIKSERLHSPCTSRVIVDSDVSINHDEEALFGNLFSEAIRSTGLADSNDHPPVAVDCVPSFSQAPLHGAHELLIFIKQAVFSPYWNSSIYEDACTQLDKKHLDVLLSILLYKACSVDNGNSDSSASLALEKKLGHIKDICFDLLHGFLSCHTLSSSLEEYLVNQFLKVENGNFVCNNHSLSLLVHMLTYTATGASQLRTRIYKEYVTFILGKTKSIIGLKNSTIKEFLGTMPCIFHIEILLMVFHLSTATEKTNLANLLLSSLKSVDPPLVGFNSAQISCWALLVSRIVLVLRHMILYPSICPSWLLLHLRSKVKKSQGDSCYLQSVNGFSSWFCNIATSIMEGADKMPPVIHSLLPHLIDVAVHPASVYGSNQVLETLGLKFDEFYSIFSWIVEIWKGKKAEEIADLLIERYVFYLCWDTAGVISELTFEASHVNCFFRLSHFLTKNDYVSNEESLHEVVAAVLGGLKALNVPHNMEEQGWEYLKDGAWLSLILSLFCAGVHRYSANNLITEVEAFEKYHLSKNDRFLSFSESIISSIYQQKEMIHLMILLSSLLWNYIEVFQASFLSSLDGSKCYTKSFSPLLILKHTAFSKSAQTDILHKSGLNILQLSAIYGLLEKLDGIIAKGHSGGIFQILMRSLLHGFPLLDATLSGALLSSALIIKDIVCTLDGLLKLKNVININDIDYEVRRQLLHIVMIIKNDMFFQCIHLNCENINNSLLNDSMDCSDIFVMKDMESFLVDIISRDIIDNDILEMVITDFIDFVEKVRKEPSKVTIFKFYLGDEKGLCDQTINLYGEQSGNLLVLMNALDRCVSEQVNIKVLSFFVDILSGDLGSVIRGVMQRKFLAMEKNYLSKWLEKRLLGDPAEGSSNGSASLRELTTNLVACVTSPSSDSQSRELHGHFVEALLMFLDNAFSSYEIDVAKAYFSFLVQLAIVESSSTKQVLERTVLLLSNLSTNEGHLQGLQFLLGFLGAVLEHDAANKTIMDTPSGKHCLGSASGTAAPAPKSLNARNTSQPMSLASDQVSGSASIECDASSGDDEEDDGTSDGELASVDKDDDGDGNAERALASKVCTFTSSGNNFMEQHWYFCYTCDLTVSKGCCSICAKVCHKGHRVVYSRSSRFFCDCGAGGVRGSSCQCLKPRKFTGGSNLPVRSTNNFQSYLPLLDNGDQLGESDSDLEDDVYVDNDKSFKITVPADIQDELRFLLRDLDLEGRVLELCNRLMPEVASRRDLNVMKDKNVSLGEDKILSHNVDILQLTRSYKSGTLDMKIKTEYSNSRELRSHLTSGSLVKSLLSINTKGRLAVGEGDKVAIYDVGQLIGQSTTSTVLIDKTNLKPLSRNNVRFEIVHLLFNPLAENYLAVSGYEECQVLTINPRGEVTDRLPIELALQGAYIRQVEWVPGSQVQLMVVSNMFVKIYDLSQDNISPIHYFTLPEDLIVDATLIVAALGRIYLLVLSETGSLYKLQLSSESAIGAKPLTEIVHVRDKNTKVKGTSLYFSSTYRLLFLSYQDGTTLIGHLDTNVTSLTESSAIYEADQEGKLRPAGLHHWRELRDGGVFVCSSLKSNALFAVSFGPHEIFSQNMKTTATSSQFLVGFAVYKPVSKNKTHFLVLNDDGGFQIFLHIPAGSDDGSNIILNQVKKLGPSILSNNEFSAGNPEFPLDFFEKTFCITADVKLSGDAIRNNDSEASKQSLASEDGFLESPSISGFKFTVSNSNPDIVMVGMRVQVGNTSVSHIPSNLTIFQRAIKLDEGIRSWYDIPFTVAESLLADEEFTISVGPTFNGSTLPRIDSLEIYGRPKDEFGWKEKIDALLDMEAHVLGSKSGVTGVIKKYRSIQSTSIQEQVIGDGLKLLSRLYFWGRPYVWSDFEDAKSELDTIRCNKLLVTIFESDREPLLQSAACRILKSMFSKKETYYHVKDTMCLYGVLTASPILASKIGIGGATTACVIQEFISQMRVVSKIASHRISNMATFLETHGSGLIDGLMQILWVILDVEQPNTQTINSIIVPCVELIYSYAECLTLHKNYNSSDSVSPAVSLFRKLLFASSEAVRTASSLAISSRLLQVPFPKQTMLASDDAIESTATVPVPSEISSSTCEGNQIMIEEDTTTSSVQYCCDGCSTVPILRRRWHCNVCPDFDLCETCYEVMNADRLPPPHSREHPMSAIPIDLDSLGGDGSEIHFVDELSSSNLLQVSVDTGLKETHNSTPSIHLLESNDSGEFVPSSMNQRIVSISASKRALNSLILDVLVRELRGWMLTTSGIFAIPIMQLFYRLSSAVGGPFMSNSKPGNMDLERFINWFLEQINVHKPLAVRTRSSFGEVAILVFMFFTLMLRNWQQPADSSPKSNGITDTQVKGSTQTSKLTMSAPSSVGEQEKEEFNSQLSRACCLLRQQSFVNYLMDILQQLTYIFKSSQISIETANNIPGSGCGALLTVRRDLPAGNYSPFFSDSYAKAHRTDLFMDYHILLLENTFRLVYSLIRPEKNDKSGEKDKVHKPSISKDFKLDGYQDVLCSYINNPHTTFVRRYARRLFLHLCGSKTHYYNVRDSWQLSNEVKKLYKLISKAGGFQNNLSYERGVKLIKSLSILAEVAGARPRNWQKYCLRHSDILTFLLNGVFHFGEESVIQTLKLLNLAFYTGKDIMHAIQKADPGDTGTNTPAKGGVQSTDGKKKKKGDDGAEINSEKSYLDMEQAVEVFMDKDHHTVLRHFIDSFLLEWNLTSVRVEAKCILYGLWHHGKHLFREKLLNVLLEKVNRLPLYGQNIVEYTELLTCLLGKLPDNSTKQKDMELINQCLTSNFIKCIYETLHSQNELLANHPNSRIYNTLSGLVEFDGYYLESEPCMACSCPEMPYSRMKLEALKSEMKFTDNRIIVKCTGSFTIQTVTMNVHDARKSKSVKVLNLYYNNRPVADLSELKNNWSLWKRAKSCHLAFNQTELKMEFLIPITACNFMIELDSFYENLQASSLESLQCPRCSRSVTDKHGICSNCHENAYQCRQCRNINYENLDSFLCNECGYSKYGRFEFYFMAKPSFSFDSMENDDDMKKGLAAIETESENAHRRYQQLLGFKKPLLKLISSIGESEIDSQQKDSVQQMMVSLPGPSCKINRKIALLGVLYGEKCKAAFDSVSKSVQTLQGLRRVLMCYLHQKHSDNAVPPSRFAVTRSPTNCYGCATIFVTQCLELLQVLSKHPKCKKQLVAAGILSELFENNLHQGPKAACSQARVVLSAFSEGDINAVTELNNLIQKKVMYCLEHHRSMDISLAIREDLLLLTETCSVADEFWEARLRLAFQLLFSSIKLGAKHPAISEHVILPCLRIISLACTPPKSEGGGKNMRTDKPAIDQQLSENSSGVSAPMSGTTNAGKSSMGLSSKHRRSPDIQLLSYYEWDKGASYLDFVRRKYKAQSVAKSVTQRNRRDPLRIDYLILKYALKWKQRVCKTAKATFFTFELGSWVSELILSACSQSIRSEMCSLVSLLCADNPIRRFQLLSLLMEWLPATIFAGESAAEYFELLFKMIESEDARLFLTVKGCLRAICKLITQEVNNIESQERSLHVDISRGFLLHKLIELLSKFLELPNIRFRFMRDELLSEVLEGLLVIQGVIVQKTKLISDCNRLLKDLLDSLLLESNQNKRHFIRACISRLQHHRKERKRRITLFILEQLCNMICPSKPEPVYLLILNKAHTQEEFIRGSMTKNPYSSKEIGPLMRDVKNKICHQLDLLGLLEDDYGMELLVAGNIISLDLSISQVYEQVWKKSHTQAANNLQNSPLPSGGFVPVREYPPMTVTYRLQGLDGEATEPMIKELEEDREESQDPEVEFAIASAVQECDGLEIILSMIQSLSDDELKSNKEELGSVLNLLLYCCKIRNNRQALLRIGALGLLLETARRAFSVDAMEPAEGILSIVESLTMEANESDIGISQSVLTVTNEEAGSGEQAKKIVLMFLERLCYTAGFKKSNKQQRNNEMVARILPYLTYGEPAAMESLIQHFDPYLQDWDEFDRLQKQWEENPTDENISEQASKQRSSLESFVRVSESLKTSYCGERLKDIILEKGIPGVAVRYLREKFSVVGKIGYKTTFEWSLGLKLPSVPLILSMLKGLARGHLPTQRCIDEGEILPLLHSLEGVSGENEIGARAENLLDVLSDKEGKADGFLGEKVLKLRNATRDEMRRRALRKREELLQGLGMRQELSADGGERIVVSQPRIEGLEDVEEEEDGFACMVCREGYTLRPHDMLGAYSYSKRVNLGVGTSGSSRGECVYTTVSHFNIIHFQCHQEAKRADAALKNPKKEWEGATLRNNETLCNCIFPLRGPSVPLQQYHRCVDQYWDNLNALGRADGTRLRLLSYDIVLMLARFATGASFSTDSKGGGRESNSRFLPFMIQMACHLLDQGSSHQRKVMAKSLSTYLTSSSSSESKSSPVIRPSDETIQFMMVTSLLSESYEDWLQHRRTFLQKGIYHAYIQHTVSSSDPTNVTRPGETCSRPQGGDPCLFSIIQPMLVYTGLIEQMQRFFKYEKVTTSARSMDSESGTSSSELEEWEVAMRDKMLNMKQMAAFSNELLSWLEDMTSASDLQEAFDVMGALTDVLSGFSHCEEFVSAAISSGK